MMTQLSYDVIHRLQGQTLATAESCTGGMIGASLTAVPGSSAVYKGGVISYTNEIKEAVLGVDSSVLDREGAVSESVACAMAEGVLRLMKTDHAISVTGLAGPGGDDFGNPVGTVFIGYANRRGSKVVRCLFEGSRETVRVSAVNTALQLLLEQL